VLVRQRQEVQEVPRRLARRQGLLLSSTVLALFVAVGSGSSAAAPNAVVCPPAGAPLAAGVAPTTPPTPVASASEPAPEQVLVCVGSQAITGATYSHWLAIAEKSEQPTSKVGQAPNVAALRNEVLGFLISASWVKGEAADLSVSVSPAKVKREFDHIRAQQFPRRSQFKAFMRQSGQTVADLLFRVELNLLSVRIQKSVESGDHSASSRQRALSRFVKAFRANWLSQTYCASEYDDANDCGHVQAVV
jgi:hypothetical protein